MGFSRPALVATAVGTLILAATAGLAAGRTPRRSSRSHRAAEATSEQQPVREAQPSANDDAKRGGDDSTDADDADDVGSPRAAATEAGGARSSYTIRQGDTLSDLSESFLGDSAGWPKLWALNPEIPNPHWITPGMVVRLSDGGEDGSNGASGVTAPGAATTVGPDARPLSTAQRAQRARAAQSPLRQLGFVDEGAFAAAGTVNGSIEEKIMLATGDQAYVEFPAGRLPRVASRFSIYRVDTDHPVKSPGSDLVLGYLVDVRGEVVIEDVANGNIASGRLVSLAGPVERGYRVGPLVSQLRRVAVRSNDVSVTGRIVAYTDQNSLIATQTFVVLDRGRRHGVAAGNRFFVLRQGDGLKRILESADTTDPRFPPHVVAEILAVDVQNETTVGWISRGSRELRVGDVVDLHRGY